MLPFVLYCFTVKVLILSISNNISDLPVNQMFAKDTASKMKCLNSEVKFTVSPDNSHTPSCSFSCASHTVCEHVLHQVKQPYNDLKH